MRQLFPRKDREDTGELNDGIGVVIGFLEGGA
jgi:hypothetical protein